MASLTSPTTDAAINNQRVDRVHNSRLVASIIVWIVILAILGIVYAPTFLTQINGSSNPYMIDVGEIQVSLNVWGTVHSTGYPLYALLGSFATTALKALGVSPALAPCLFSLFCGFVSLTLFYALILRLTGRIEIAGCTTLLLGLTRTIWVYNVVSKEYSMNSIFEILLLLVAFWPPGITKHNVHKRVLLLALIGGLGVAHHRTVILLAPALLVAVLPALWASGRRALLTLGFALILGIAGFIPYFYLPLRAAAHGDWVYGDPGTLAGFWEQFSGAEASFLVHLPINGQAWSNDISDTFRILVTELTPILAVISGGALLWAMVGSRYRHLARIAFIGSLGYFVFLFALHQVVMPQAVAIPIVIIMMFGLALLLDKIFLLVDQHKQTNISILWWLGMVLAAVTGSFALIAYQRDFIFELTHNDTGKQIITLAQEVPPQNAVMMIPWGPRFHALGYSKYVTKENATLLITDHKADFRTLMSQGKSIYTVSDTFFGEPFNDAPLPWWENHVGHVYLTSPVDGLLAVNLKPELVQSGIPVARDIAHGITLQDYSVCIQEQTINLTIQWAAERPPDADLSVFVHLLNADSPVPLATADSRAPVYGWYPTTRWSTGELVTEHYKIALQAGATRLAFGMYEQLSTGEFKNYGEQMTVLSSVSPCAVLPSKQEAPLAKRIAN